MKKYFFNDEWKEWIWSNITKGVSKQKICNELIEQDYDIFTIINELRFIPDIFRKHDEIGYTNVISCLEKSGAIKVDVPIPFFIFKDFITEKECKEIIEIQKIENARSTTGDNKYSKVNEMRTSFTTYFENIESNLDLAIIQSVKQKILSLMSIPIQYSERIQGQWYKSDGFYHDHFDAYDDYNQFQSYSGNRTWTFIVTLNEVQKGGDTYFPRLNKYFKPKVGQALIWYNLNEYGLAHPLTMHTGNPVLKGEKFILTQWFRQSSL